MDLISRMRVYIVTFFVLQFIAFPLCIDLLSQAIVATEDLADKIEATAKELNKALLVLKQDEYSVEVRTGIYIPKQKKFLFLDSMQFGGKLNKIVSRRTQGLASPPHDNPGSTTVLPMRQ